MSGPSALRTAARVRIAVREQQEARLDRSIHAAFALATLFATAAGLALPGNLSLGLVLMAATAPFWWSVTRRNAVLTALLVAGAAACVAGVALAAASTDHAIDRRVLITQLSAVLSVSAGASVVVWARRHVSLLAIALAVGIGLLVGLNPTASLFMANPWRFGFSVSVTYVVLALARRSRKPLFEVAALLGFSGLAAATDARSTFALLLLAALLFGGQYLIATRSPKAVALFIPFAALGFAAVIYGLGQALILEGALGEVTRARSEEQIARSGSLITGGRPELAATLALMTARPVGFGAGVVPELGDLRIAQEGMVGVGYDPLNGYVTRYLFGSAFELHSIAGDLWAWLGLAGLALAAVWLVVIVRGVAVGVATRSASGLLLFVSLKACWALAFSPVATSVPLLLLALGLAASVTTAAAERAGAPSPVVTAVR